MKAQTKIAATLLIALTGAAHAEVIFDTGVPDGGFIGYYGFDIAPDQSVAVAFTPDESYTLDEVGLWMMSNDFDNAGAAYTLSIRTDLNGGMTSPSDTVLESWDIQTSAVGWNPVLDTVDSILNPVLSAGMTYWIVAESDSIAQGNAVWVASQQVDPVWHAFQTIFDPPGEWGPGGYTNGAPGVVVSGSVVPAPSAMAILGLGGLVGTRRRRS